MEQDILTPAQRLVLAEIASEEALRRYYLTGGTALAAFYLHHRASDDLDFFTADDSDMLLLQKFSERLAKKLGTTSPRYERLHDRRMFFFALQGGNLKIEFTTYPFAQLEKPAERDGLRIDSLRDIAANKLAALLDRFDPKDFVDLYFLIKNFGLDAVRTDAEKKFGMRIGDMFFGGELAKVRRIEALPAMRKPLPLEELKQFFTEQAKTLAPNILT